MSSQRIELHCTSLPVLLVLKANSLLRTQCTTNGNHAHYADDFQSIPFDQRTNEDVISRTFGEETLEIRWNVNLSPLSPTFQNKHYANCLCMH